ncbi:30S ribosome-binding factor RbfA [Treponema sp.]
MSEYRLERLGRQIQEELGAMIVAGKVKDPRVDSFLSISHVDVSRDLSFADVYVSSFDTEKGVERGVTGLNSAASFLQRQLNAKMHIRQTPKLRFHADLSVREGFDLIKKIEGLDT